MVAFSSFIFTFLMDVNKIEWKAFRYIFCALKMEQIIPVLSLSVTIFHPGLSIFEDVHPIP